ncbi:2-dehydro-3-deoxygluconokinase [Fontibacillus panacisegetis]|uniref:2-dehydro-3-deoxygluconokinase n=1 Tax=Fontibacillus panacisegetis TaxID=670482 RepID=A0A1G7RH49_9BACL|nr:sugar kinase [Fontibacillus panacisegetis]SDG09954.1 2-dehydro-3-deoxygluconokinase [Fontibacillus panacisegetis]
MNISARNLQASPEVVTFGESMALLIAEGGKGLEYASNLSPSFGGAESNVAIGLARLGHASGWCGRLGDDPFGHRILKAIRGEGVDTSRARLTDEAPTGLMIRENVAGRSSVHYYRKLSAASFMRPEHLDEAYIAGAKILHITGITPALSPSCIETATAAVDIAKRNGVKVSFDPNLRLKLWSVEEARKVLLPLAMKADYFLPGLDELNLLYETDSMETIKDKLQELDAVSILKGGDNCTYILENGKLTSVPYFKVEQVIDTVGAGDGFCAGFLAGLIRGYSMEEAVRLGNLIGSQVIQAVGDWEGLPNAAEIERLLAGKGHVER